MELMEKAAYLKGLVDGLDIDMTTKEGKVLAAIMDVLNELTDVVYDISDEVTETVDLVDAIDEDLGAIEEDYYGEDCCCCDDDECDDDCMYEAVCPSCSESICLTEEDVNNGGMMCPFCGEKLEFEYDEDADGESEE